MEKFKRRVVRYLGASVAFVTLTGTFMTMLAATASATPTTLYVLAGATGTSCSGDASTTACPSIGDALAFIAASSSNISPTTIEVGAGTFQEHGLVVSGNVTIMGQGPSSTIIDGTNSGQVVDIGSGNVELSGMTIEHGSSGNGGGILNTGNLTLSNDLLQSNSGSNGGAVYNAATLTATDDTFDQNSVGLNGSGGAIDNGGPATLTNDTFTDNSTGNNGVEALLPTMVPRLSQTIRSIRTLLAPTDLVALFSASAIPISTSTPSATTVRRPTRLSMSLIR